MISYATKHENDARKSAKVDPDHKVCLLLMCRDGTLKSLSFHDDLSSIRLQASTGRYPEKQSEYVEVTGGLDSTDRK